MKKINPKILIFILITLCVYYCSHKEKSENDDKIPIGMSPNIFKGTEAYPAANAITMRNYLKLEHELNENPDLVDMQDHYYGHTLLSLAIIQDKTEAVEILLNQGSDMAIFSDSIHETGTNAVLDAAGNYYKNPKIMKMLLERGGDPNSYTRGKQYDNVGNLIPYRYSALGLTSKAGEIEKSKLLIDYGAEVNFRPPGGLSPLNLALSMGGMEMTYLLLTSGANYNEHFIKGGYRIPEKLEYESILVELRRKIPKIDSREFEYKMKVIDFLKERGLDYTSTPIDEHTLKRIKRLYPDTWQEYIKVY